MNKLIYELFSIIQDWLGRTLEEHVDSKDYLDILLKLFKMSQYVD